ncbi:alpha/beta fold hydrolase [Streptomyces cavernae]|uniref:alpha/beta fold hydrolase n=1 Tax=Streptomyces cavernae TaxID=2259034 RepID=UPI000FEC0924|nr:alpha/beta hydrolase [Streptomyces cavernae]
MSTIAVKSAQLENGPLLPYAEAGYPGGVPVVFVHGIGDSWWSFEPVLKQMSTALHAYAPTQRGHGDAERPAQGYRPRDFADDLVGFLDAVGVARAVLVGASSGGVPARIVAGSHPDRVAGLVLMGAPATLADSPGLLARWESVGELSDPVPRSFVEELLGGMVHRAVGRGFLETITEENLKVPARVWRESVRGLLETDLAATLRGILVPTLLLWGEEDAYLPRSEQQLILDALFDATLLGYPGVGHALYWEQPQRVAQDITRFATQVVRASG